MTIPVKKIKTHDDLIAFRVQHFNENPIQADKHIRKFRASMAAYLLTMAIKDYYKRVLEFMDTSVKKK